MKVTSPNEGNLLQFIKEIEKMERVMHVDTIDFSLPGELDEFVEETTATVLAAIQVTTFYYE